MLKIFQIASLKNITWIFLHLLIVTYLGGGVLSEYSCLHIVFYLHFICLVAFLGQRSNIQFNS